MLIKKIQQHSNNLAKKVAQKLVRYPILAPVALLLIILFVTPFALFQQSLRSLKKLFTIAKKNL
mgnify:CR=1 FL=1